MAKYTDEQIIAYLRTLREGVVLTAVADSEDFYTEGREYVIQSNPDGDLYVGDNVDNFDYVSIGDSYDYDVADYFRLGVFEIPSPAIANKPFYIDITSFTLEPHSPTQYIEITADSAGFARLKELEAEGKKSRDLAHLYAKLAGIQAEIDRLEAQ